MIATQKDKNVEFECKGEKEIFKNCNSLKLMRTLYNKQGEKYSKKQMEEWGFELK